VEYFDEMVEQDNIIINYNTLQQLKYLVEYIEGWRLKIWDQGFGPYFKGANYFKKEDSFGSFEKSQ